MSNLNVFIKTYPKIQLLTEASVRRLCFFPCSVSVRSVIPAWLCPTGAVLRAGEKGTTLLCAQVRLQLSVTWGWSGEVLAEEHGKVSGGGLGAACALIFHDLKMIFGYILRCKPYPCPIGSLRRHNCSGLSLNEV